ncbi:EI24 domain-containing protein [Actinacidiphila alni]|uniref:EI24 domain-containing protein n=1 Tax=Actinacidiphila alni TaxID=380248 RepID=UPI0034515A1E
MREMWRGVRLLGRGLGWAARHGREWRLGMVPALITFVGYVAALVALVVWTDDLVAWATPFADHWASPWAGVFRGLLDAVVVGGGLLLAVISFTAVTLLVGQPFYETIAARVDRAEGGAEGPELGLWRELWIGARDSVRVLLRVAAFAIVLFALGFVPVAGQTVVPAIGFCVSGFFLTLELTAVAMQRRDVPLRDRIRILRSRLPLVLGFGVPLVLAFLVPFVAVFLMPGAVAGATLLAREVLPPDPAAPGPGPDDDEGDEDTAAPGAPGFAGPPGS